MAVTIPKVGMDYVVRIGDIVRVANPSKCCHYVARVMGVSQHGRKIVVHKLVSGMHELYTTPGPELVREITRTFITHGATVLFEE